MTLLMKNFLYRSKVNITVWAPQSPPTEDLWGELKSKVHAREA